MFFVPPTAGQRHRGVLWVSEAACGAPPRALGLMGLASPVFETRLIFAPFTPQFRPNQFSANIKSHGKPDFMQSFH
jgi:hypothetical protein